MHKTILIVGTFDTKGEEYAFLKRLIEARGHKTLMVNVGVFEASPLIRPDVDSDVVAKAGGGNILVLREKDRGPSMKIMSDGAAVIVRQLFDEGKFDGVIGMGGSGGTSIVTAGMRTLPIGIPKVVVSTLASADTSPYVGTRDITIIPSVVDVPASFAMAVSPIEEPDVAGALGPAFPK